MRFIIEEYINKINTSDIISFAFANNLELSLDEAEVLLFYLKNNWEDILYKDPLPIIQEIEQKIGKDKTDIIVSLFYYYKEKYKDYL